MTMNITGGRLLLLLASRDPQTVAQLSASGEVSAAAILPRIHHLVDQGYALVETDAGTDVYRLAPKGRSAESDRPQRVLILDDDPSLQRLAVSILEDEGYAVVAVGIESDALVLLDEVTFDLILSDSLSRDAETIETASAEIRAAAGATPVVLFTAHKLDIDAALLMGFQDLIAKPFDLSRFEHQVRRLLQFPSSPDEATS